MSAPIPIDRRQYPPIALVAAIMSAWLACATAHAQTPAELGPAVSVREVRALLRLHLTLGQRVPFMGEQTTRLMGDRTAASTQIVKRAGKDRERIEYLSPPNVRGEVILRVGRRLLHLRRLPEPHVTEAEAPLDGAEMRLRALLDSVMRGRVTVALVGEQLVAARRAKIVEIRPSGPGPVRRLWIDPETGVRLRHETVDAQGMVTSTSYFTAIDYQPNLSARDFMPEALEALVRKTVLPGAVRAKSLTEAQGSLSFRIRVPELPSPFELTDIWLIGPKRARGVTLQYSDGVNAVRVSQRKVSVGAARAAMAAGRAPVIRQGFAYWIHDGVLYTVSGPVQAAFIRNVLRSLK